MGLFTVREAVCNGRSRVLLTFSVAAILTALFVSVSYAEIDASRQAQVDSRSLVSDGYATLLVTSNDQLRPSLTAADCDRLGVARGVRASTWMTQGSPTTLWAAAGPELPTFLTGVPALVIVRSSNVSLETWSGEQVLIDSDSDIVRGGRQSITLNAISPMQPATAIALAPADLGILGQGATVGLVAIGLPPHGNVDSCVVLAEMAHRNAVRAAIQTSFPSEQGYETQWGLPNADRFANPIDIYSERASRFAWMAATAAALVVIGFHLRLRRRDYAFYSIAGLSTSRLRQLIVAETLGNLLIATVCASTVMAVQSRRLDAALPIAAGWVGLLRTLLATITATTALCWLTAETISERAAVTLKDR